MRLILECKPDEQLAKSLGIPRRSIIHQNDKGEVCNYLRKYTANIGLIDEDPKSAQPKLLMAAPIIEEKHQIKIRKSPIGFRLIVICPKLEDWLITTAMQSNIEIKEFGLSDSPNQLHREINNKLDRLDLLVKRLLESKSERILYLQSLILNP